MSAATIIGTNVDLDRKILSPNLPDGIDIDQDEYTAYVTTRDAPQILTIGLNGSGPVEVLLDGSDGLSEPRDVNLVKNQSPVASAGTGVRIQEGADAAFDASSSTDPEGSPLYFKWDIDNDGDFDDATGAAPVVTWATLTSLGLSNGTSIVRVEVSDGIDASVATTALTIANDMIYWTDFVADKIQATDLTNVAVVDILDTGVGSNPIGIAVDSVNRRIFYVDQKDPDTVYGIDFDGSNRSAILSFPGNEAYDVAFDSTAQKLFGTLRTTKQIYSCDPDGSNFQAVLTFGTGSPTGIDVDPASSQVYWIDSGLSQVFRANYDGTNQVTISTGLNSPLGVAYDARSSSVFWTERFPGKIRMRPVNASGPTGVATDVLTGVGTPRGIVINANSGMMYWVQRDPDEIRFSSTDGTLGIQSLVATEGQSADLAIVPNTRPMASAGGDYTINEGASLLLNASGSTDAEGGTLSYAWDLDNDGDYDDAAGVNPSVDWATLQALGVVDDVNDIAVEVSDGHVTGTAATTLTIVNLAPNASTGGPYTINEGSSLVLDATGTTDPGGDAIGLYEWDIDGDLDYDEAIGAQPTIPWNALRTAGLGNGTNTLRVRVTDAGNVTNLSDTSSTLLTVNNLPPITDVFERSITKIQVLDEPAPGFLAAVTDPGGDPISIVSWDTESVFGATVTVNQATGAFTYDPSSSKTLLRLSEYEEIVDSFTYIVQDSESSTKAQVTGTVNVIVSGDSGIPAVGLLGRLGIAAAMAALGGVKLRRRKK